MPELCVQPDVAVAILHFKVDKNTFAKNAPWDMQPRRPKTGVPMLMELKRSLLEQFEMLGPIAIRTHCSLPSNKKARVVCMTP